MELIHIYNNDLLDCLEIYLKNLLLNLIYFLYMYQFHNRKKNYFQKNLKLNLIFFD